MTAWFEKHTKGTTRVQRLSVGLVLALRINCCLASLLFLCFLGLDLGPVLWVIQASYRTYRFLSTLLVFILWFVESNVWLIVAIYFWAESAVSFQKYWDTCFDSQMNFTDITLLIWRTSILFHCNCFNSLGTLKNVNFFNLFPKVHFFWTCFLYTNSSSNWYFIVLQKYESEIGCFTFLPLLQ